MSEQAPEQVDRRELIRLIDMGIQVEAFINWVWLFLDGAILLS